MYYLNFVKYSHRNKSLGTYLLKQSFMNKISHSSTLLNYEL